MTGFIAIGTRIEGVWDSQVALVLKKNPPGNAGDSRDVGFTPGLGRWCGIRDLSSSTRKLSSWTTDWSLLHWKIEILTTGPPRKSQFTLFLYSMSVMNTSICTLDAIAVFFQEGKTFLFLKAQFYFKEGSSQFQNAVKSEKLEYEDPLRLLNRFWISEYLWYLSGKVDVSLSILTSNTN